MIVLQVFSLISVLIFFTIVQASGKKQNLNEQNEGKFSLEAKHSGHLPTPPEVSGEPKRKLRTRRKVWYPYDF